MNRILFTAIFGLLYLLPGPASAERAIDGVVQAGSSGNRTILSFTNPSADTPIENATLEIAQKGSWITNILIKPDGSGPIAPGSTRQYTVLFDIAPDAPNDAIDEVTLQVEAEGALVDQPSQTIVVKIENSDRSVASIDHSAASVLESSAPVLKLVKISGPRPGDHTPGYIGDPGEAATKYHVAYTEGEPGFIASNDGRYARPKWIGALRITRAPVEITMGQPFEIAVEVKKRAIYESGQDCTRRLDEAGNPRIEYPCFWSPRISFPMGNVKTVSRDDLHAYCESNDTGMASGNKLAQRVEKDGFVSLRISFSPERVEVDHHSGVWTERKYHYKLSWQTEGELKTYTQPASFRDTNIIEIKKDIDEKGNLHPQAEVSAFGPLEVRLIWKETLILHYNLVHDGAPYIASLPKFPWSAELTQPPKGDSNGEKSIAGDDAGSAGYPSASRGRGATEQKSSSGTVDPATLDPNHPDVSKMIRAWISAAEPPENATEGARLRYDQWGRKVGTTGDGGILSASGKPGFARATPEATLWAMRDKLDSVDHCTLEKYVVAGLQQEAIDACRGRYAAAGQISVSQLTGLSLARVKDKLSAAGLKPRLVAGEAAPSKEKAGTVASQSPPPGTELKPGQEVKLVIYGPYNAKVTIDDITGLDVKSAKARFEAKGIAVRLVAADPAPSPELSHKVKETDPKAGSSVTAGTEVVFKIYGKYQPVGVTIPDIIGLPWKDAKARLQGMGLKARPVASGNATSPARSGTVSRVAPGVGQNIPKGTTVEVSVLGKYKPQAKQSVADLTGEWLFFNISREGDQYIAKFRDGRRKGEIAYKFGVSPRRVTGYSAPVYVGHYWDDYGSKRWIHTIFEFKTGAVTGTSKTYQSLDPHVFMPDGRVYHAPRFSRTLLADQ